MAYEVDHVFVCVDVEAPEAERLTAFGLTEGRPNAHPGQGTACRRFFFANAYLELLWVYSPKEAQSERSRRIGLWERWSGRHGASCPFGICIRPPADHQHGDVPFETWDYRPSYMPSGVGFSIAKNSQSMTEPFLCYLESGKRPDCYDAHRQQPMGHATGLGEITRVTLVAPQGERPSADLQSITKTNLVAFRAGDQHCLELSFDGEHQRKRADFRPGLPLIFNW
jgi:hypothetical protein